MFLGPNFSSFSKTSKRPQIDRGISQHCGGLQSSYFAHSLGTYRAYFAPHLRGKLLIYHKKVASFPFFGQNLCFGPKYSILGASHHGLILIVEVNQQFSRHIWHPKWGPNTPWGCQDLSQMTSRSPKMTPKSAQTRPKKCSDPSIFEELDFLGLTQVN